MQLILAGKAHPADQAGQALIREWIQFIRRPEVRPHVIFLSDYDMLLTEHLVQGVDVWINTPRRPWEACGTSGMKVLVNGGINLSELDGWWAEAYTPEVGWALGDGQEHGDDPAWDAAEAAALYDLLEREVIPEFYTRNEQGIPTAWVARMRESMAQLTPQFSANRAVREYTEQHYIPAAAAYRERAANKGAVGAQVVDWQHTLEQKWATLRFGEAEGSARPMRSTTVFEVEVFLGSLDPNSVRVELYADGVNGGEPERQEMKRAQPLPDANGPSLSRSRYPRHAQPQTIQRESYRSTTALRSRWRPPASYGNDEGGQMKRAIPVTTLFLDIGGVLLTDGWGHQSRALAAKAFDLNLEEMEERHHLTFDTYEVGKLTLKEYLSRTVFYEERSFTQDQFREFMFAQSQPYPEMIDAHPPAQGTARTENRRGQQRSARTECASDSQVQAGGVRRFLHFLLASSTSASPTPTSIGWRWTPPKRQPGRSSISKTPRCSSRWLRD